MINQLIYLLIYVVCVGLLCWLIYWIVDAIPIPEPINRFIKIAVVVIGVIALILILLKVVPAGAAECKERAPYYHKMTNSVGSRLADVFLFAFTVPVATLATTAGQPQSACVPLHLAHHFVTGRPPK